MDMELSIRPRVSRNYHPHCDITKFFVEVIINDVEGYNTTLSKAEKTFILGDCTTRMRLRYINVSAYARFYIFFSDMRKFDVIELDGVSYLKKETDMLEVASGQRVSIVVGAKSTTGVCSNAYIIAASDPKMNHGSKRCPMELPGSAPVQYTHAYLEVDPQKPIREKAVLDKNDFVISSLNTWSTPIPDPVTSETRNNMQFPAGTWSNTTEDEMLYRMQLPYGANSYKRLYYNTKDNNDYGAPTASRTTRALLGTSDAEELGMTPAQQDPAWLIPAGAQKSDYMHYFTLAEVRYTDPKSPAKGGFASMGENIGTQPGQNQIFP